MQSQIPASTVCTTAHYSGSTKVAVPDLRTNEILTAGEQVKVKPSANPQRIVLVVVLVIVIETSQVEHEDDDENDPQSGPAESIQLKNVKQSEESA
jgi:hypothetical protein